MRIPLLIAANPATMRQMKGPVVPVDAGRWKVITSTLDDSIIHMHRLNDLPPASVNIYDGYEFELLSSNKLQVQLTEVNGRKDIHVYIESI